MASAQKVEAEGEKEDSKRKHLVFKESEDRTLFYLKSGLGIDEIVKQCNETKAIVLSHIAKLVAKGKLEAVDYVPLPHFEVIVSLFDKHGIHADRKLLRSIAPDVKFAEIEIVRAQLSRTVSKSEVLKSSADTKLIERPAEKGSLILEISPKTFEKIKKGKKKSYKKIIYRQEEARMFFIENSFDLSNVSDNCPYTLRKYDIVKFVSSESSIYIEKQIISVLVEAAEVSSGNKRWSAIIDFK